MKQSKIYILTALSILALSAAVVGLAPEASAQLVDPCAQLDNCDPDEQSVEGAVSTIIDILLYVIGFVAVIVLIIGGIMYASSAGDPGRTKKAKDTILYAIIGLAVAIFAWAIVSFVIARLT